MFKVCEMGCGLYSLCEQGLIPEISAGVIAAEDPILEETMADDREEGELVSSPSQHKDLDVVAEDTRTTKIRRIIYVSRMALVLVCVFVCLFECFS